MPDTKITDLTAITGANTASGDVFVVVDVSDTSMAGSGTNKKITKAELALAVGGWTEVEIDFGSTPVSSKTFTITDAAVSSTLNISVQPSGKPATDRVGNDFEWDIVQFTAVPGTGNFVLAAAVVNGHVRGKRKVLYKIAT